MTRAKQEIEAMIDSVIREEFRHFDLRPYADRIDESYAETPQYLLAHKHEYIRTLDDVLQFAERTGVRRVLEIGAFFGIVSICLARCGMQVVAADIPEYMGMPEQRERFCRHGVEIAEVRLENYVLPFESERFGVVIMCEVLEHLNFNPLPLLKEINRVGAAGSLFYLSLPNLAQYRNRVRFLLWAANPAANRGVFQSTRSVQSRDRQRALARVHRRRNPRDARAAWLRGRAAILLRLKRDHQEPYVQESARWPPLRRIPRVQGEPDDSRHSEAAHRVGLPDPQDGPRVSRHSLRASTRLSPARVKEDSSLLVSRFLTAVPERHVRAAQSPLTQQREVVSVFLSDKLP